jgi:hypothetical protein
MVSAGGVESAVALAAEPQGVRHGGSAMQGRYLFILLILLLAPRPCAAQLRLELDVSASDQEIVHYSLPWVGERVLYLWATDNVGTQAFDHAEVGLTGTLEVVSFTPRGSWTNEGTGEDLVLNRSECMPAGEEVAGELVVRDPHGFGGSVCFGFSTHGRMCARPCGSGEWLGLDTVGFGSEGVPVCAINNNECDEALAVTGSGWGETKAMYR